MTPSFVRAAGILAIIGGCFSLFGALALLFFLAGPYVFYTRALGVTIALLAALAVLGFSIGARLLRRARITP
jgi:hypothetical protein